MLLTLTKSFGGSLPLEKLVTFDIRLLRPLAQPYYFSLKTTRVASKAFTSSAAWFKKHHRRTRITSREASEKPSVMKIAIEGCCHGELDNIYATIDQAVKQTGSPPPDVLICCGDFQAFRNRSDLNTFAAPVKYRQMGDFWKYYNGEKVAPILTVFVGGNHEASGYLWELFYGGWAAPNIYFLGVAGSIILKKTLQDGSVHKIRISGASGIYKRHDYRTGHHERLPYDNSTIRSIYHIREYDVFRLKQLPLSSCDIFVSHDWPVGIEQFGNTAQLIRAKPFFKDEIASNTLGSPPLMEILQVVKPSYWFSAHLHVKFAALVRHIQQGKLLNPTQGHGETSSVLNPDELNIDVDSDSEPAIPNESQAAEINACNPDQILIDDIDEEEEDICPAKQERLLASNPTAPRKVTPNPDQIQSDESEPETPGHPDQQLDVFSHAPTNSANENASHKHDIQTVASSCTQVSSAETFTPKSLDANASVPVRMTRFLALDKCMPRKDFLQIINIPLEESNREVGKPAQSLLLPDHPLPEPQRSTAIATGNPGVALHFDPHWLAITRAFHSQLPLSKYENQRLPMNPVTAQEMVNNELRWIETTLAGSSLKIDDVQQFTKTAPGLGDPGGDDPGQPFWYTNPQTIAFTEFLQIENKINPQPTQEET